MVNNNMAESPDTSSKSKKILIIEDEEALAQALQIKLAAAGYSVKIVLNGQEGMDSVTSDFFDLILLDLILPLVDGFVILEKLHEQGNKTPVIVLSNFTQEEDVVRVKALGAVEYLVKADIQLSKVLELIQKTLQ